MSTTTEDSNCWSRERWGLVVFLVLALHLGALVLFSAHHESGPIRRDDRHSVRWLTSPAETRKVLDSLLDNDPTLLAAVTPGGFSGAAWLRPAPSKYQIGEWNDTERSLALPLRPMASLPSFVGKPPQLVLDPARKPVTPAPVPTVAQPALRDASRMTVEGPLASRKLLRVPSLKVWPYSDLLKDSRVRVLVNREGLVFSRRLASNGLRQPAQRAADQFAHDVAGSLRFEPLPESALTNRDALTEGELVFQWLTVEPAETPVKP
ncbi:MAG: hypothetical protein EBS05_08395 [Proteobacteria bacterium]|nr:hypothetical protein [Pseudomonadota bacterium]